MSEIDLNECKSNLECHQDIVAEVDILDLFESGNVFLVDLSIILFPLEGSADLLDVVLELDEERLHCFVVVRLNDIDLLLHFFFEDYKETIVTHQSIYSSPDEADLLLWKAYHVFFREEHKLGLSDLCP